MFKRVVSFIAIEESHTGINVANLIVEELGQLKIDQRIFTISLDNASNNNVAVDFLKRNLSLPCHGELFHVRCICHILNLIVQSAFSEIKPMIEKVRTVANMHNASEMRIKR